MRLTEKEKTIFEKNTRNSDLSEQLLNMKEKYKIKENDFEAFMEDVKKESAKNDTKDVNYGKHNFSIFYDKIREFAEGLYNYTNKK